MLSSTTILLLIIGIIILFLYVFIQSCKKVTVQDDNWVYKVNNHDYCDYETAKGKYLEDVLKGIESSTISVIDEDGILVYTGIASDFFEKIEHNAK